MEWTRREGRGKRGHRLQHRFAAATYETTSTSKYRRTCAQTAEKHRNAAARYETSPTFGLRCGMPHAARAIARDTAHGEAPGAAGPPPPGREGPTGHPLPARKHVHPLPPPAKMGRSESLRSFGVHWLISGICPPYRHSRPDQRRWQGQQSKRTSAFQGAPSEPVKKRRQGHVRDCPASRSTSVRLRKISQKVHF
jgi:hypothetical protein